MSIALNYLTPMELHEIEQDRLPGLIEERNSPFLEAFPLRPIEDTVIAWDKYDNFTGLMNFRGYNNKPGRVKDIGSQRYMTQPGVYGEFMQIDEDLLTRRGMIGRLSEKMDVSDQVGLLQRKLLGRRLDRIEWIISKFVISGTYTVPDLTGVAWNGDSWTPPAYSPPTYAWTDYANSTPLADMQKIALIPFGQSVSTGPEAELVMNRRKFNDLTLNRNQADFWGYRQSFGATVGQDLNAINSILMAQGLPRIRIYEGNYAADGSRTGTYTRFIVDSTAVLFAKRTSGAKTGAFAITWNAQSRAAAPYTFVKDRREEVPNTVEVHDGFNGGPLIEYPGTIVVVTGI